MCLALPVYVARKALQVLMAVMVLMVRLGWLPPVGPQGSAGADGVNGRDGKDGKDGRSVVSVYCSGGRLVVKYSDGGVSTVSGSAACEGVKPSPIVTISSHK